IEQYRSVRVEPANEAAQLGPGTVRQPVVYDVQFEVPLMGQAQPFAEVASADERMLFETERRNFPRVFLVFNQKDALSLSVGVHHTFCSLRFFVVFLKLPMSILSRLFFEVKEISAKRVRKLWRFAYACTERQAIRYGERKRPKHRSNSPLIKAQVAYAPCTVSEISPPSRSLNRIRSSYMAKPGDRVFIGRSGSRC